MKNLGTDIRPEYAILTIDGEKVTNVIDMELHANENGNTATIIIDLDPPSKDDDDDEGEDEGPSVPFPQPGGAERVFVFVDDRGICFRPLPLPDRLKGEVLIPEGRN